jgi:type IV pilus assembly protein PilA
MFSTGVTSRGFSLLELMIAMAIVGVLAAMAIPAYQAYMSKSQVAEAFELVTSVKSLTADYYGQTSTWPANGIAGIPSPTSIAGTYVEKVTVSSANGDIIVTMRNSGISKALQGQTLTFRPNVPPPPLLASIVVIYWECTSAIKQAYLPISACKGS